GTLCCPLPSLELIRYGLLKLPGLVGANVTATSTLSSGLRTRPSGSGGLTTKGSAGGAAFVIVTARFPVLETVSVLVTEAPTGTAPKFSAAGVIASSGWPA